jgi:hypothetical protein
MLGPSLLFIKETNEEEGSKYNKDNEAIVKTMPVPEGDKITFAQYEDYLN